jgi:hypothetical protein
MTFMSNFYSSKIPNVGSFVGIATRDERQAPLPCNQIQDHLVLHD